MLSSVFFCAALFCIGCASFVAPRVVVPDAEISYTVFDLIRMWGLFACALAVVCAKFDDFVVKGTLTAVVIVSIVLHVYQIRSRGTTYHHIIAIVANVVMGIAAWCVTFG